MISTAQILKLIAEKKTPPVILVGGNNDFLVDRAFADIRAAIEDPSVIVEPFSETADLPSVLDSFRTMSLFGGRRLLILPEVNAFVSKKELMSLLTKALDDWKSAKTDRKRSTATAKLLHVVGLVGLDLDANDSEIAEALGVRADGALVEMLQLARATGKRASRGETDAAMLAEAATQGGAPGTTLLMKSGDLPRDSATVATIDRAGVVVICDLDREAVPRAVDQAIAQIESEYEVKFDPRAVSRLKVKLGIERMLADKFSREVPDLRRIVSEGERLATFTGAGGRVTVQTVDAQIAEVTGGARFEFGGLAAEGKAVDAIAKLHDLVAESRRDDPKTPTDIHFGRYLFALADEIRQMIGIHSFARLKKIDLARTMQYNRFKDLLAESLGDYLKENRLVRQKPHPFALHKRFEAAGRFREWELAAALQRVAQLEVERKSGGIGPDLGMEILLMDRFSKT